MAFTSLRTILESKGAEHPALREAVALRELSRVWKTRGITLFPKKAQRNIRNATTIRSFRRHTVHIGVNESASAALLQYEKQRILALLSRACPELEIRDIVVRVDGSRRKEIRQRKIATDASPRLP